MFFLFLVSDPRMLSLEPRLLGKGSKVKVKSLLGKVVICCVYLKDDQGVP